MRIASVLFVVAGLSVTTSAQDPLKTLPESYRIQFENDWVRVVRVHFDAGAKLPEHTHPAGTTAYVYLNESDGVVFRHSGRISRATTRPAVKTGSIRLSSGEDETHAVENPASTPSDFLRILLKAKAAGGRTMRRITPTETEFANAQLKITRLKVAAGGEITLQTNAEPALVVMLPSGATRWIEAGASDVVKNAGSAPLDLVRFDFLTPPQ
jgi:hypothetical protein